MTELIRMTAMEIVAGLRGGGITPLDCLDALERRIAAVDGPAFGAKFPPVPL